LEIERRPEMAEAGLFVGWGAPVRGREVKSLDVFQEALAFYAGRKEKGEIEDFEVVLLAPHGGDLGGFLLVKGSADQIAAIRASEDFDRLNTRAGLVVDQFGVVDAVVDEAVAGQIETFREAAGELG
jgi:hypothetical protein